MAPAWVKDGGMWLDPDNHTYIGFVLDESDREYYVPDTLVELTVAEVKTRVLDINSRYPALDEEGAELTEEELTASVDNWVSAVS